MLLAQCDTGGGAALICCTMMAFMLPSNRHRPVSISNMTQPSEYKSAAGVTSTPRMCSGAM